VCLSSTHLPAQPAAGDKCKFSHDLAIARKSAKASIYEDTRQADQIADWDQAKLESVVNSKHGAEAGKGNKTDIVCMYFLDALEKELYGWFWECPVSSQSRRRCCCVAGSGARSRGGSGRACVCWRPPAARSPQPAVLPLLPPTRACRASARAADR